MKLRNSSMIKYLARTVIPHALTMAGTLLVMPTVQNLEFSGVLDKNLTHTTLLGFLEAKSTHLLTVLLHHSRKCQQRR